MDALDAFGAGVDAPQDDPFASAEEEFTQGDPLAGTDGGEVVADIPVVNADGERIEDPAPAPAPAPAPVAEPDPTPAVAPTGGERTAQSADQIDSDVAGQGTAVQAEDLDRANDEVVEADKAPVDVNEAPVPKPTTDKKGAVTHRQYMIFQPDGAGRWREVVWYEDKAGKMVAKGDGAKRQKVCLARGQEDALKIGFNALGSPKEGAKLVAIALTYFQVRHVEPDPEPPIRQRLKIR